MIKWFSFFKEKDDDPVVIQLRRIEVELTVMRAKMHRYWEDYVDKQLTPSQLAEQVNELRDSMNEEIREAIKDMKNG